MEELVYWSKLADQAGRYNDMVGYMAKVIKSVPELNQEERNMLNTAYRNVIGVRRTAWRFLMNTEGKEDSRGNSKNAELARAYKLKIEDELNGLCQEALEIVSEILNKKHNDSEGRVFFLKMMGDFYRYMAEYQTLGPNKQKYGTGAADNASRSYQEALKNSFDLETTHPVRLGLALNYAVFLYEVKELASDANNIARQAFDSAMEDIESTNEEYKNESMAIIQLIRDNMAIWNAELKEQPTQDIDED